MTIQKSEQLNELFAALSELQVRIKQPKKDQSGYKDNFKFADLSQYIDLSKDALAEFGLSVLQFPTTLEIVEITKEVIDEKTKIKTLHSYKIPKQTIITFIGHASGQFISGAMDILVEKLAGMSWGQSTGSAITYARRYSRSGALGMTQEDDDNQKQPEVKKISGRTNSKNEPPPKIDNIMAQNLAQLLQGDEERLRKTLDWAKASKIDDLTVSQYETVMRRIQEDSKAKVDKTEQPATEIIRTVLDTSQLIAEHQVNFIKRLVTPERLLKVLQDYKLSRLEEMTIKDFNALTDALRLEALPNYQPKPIAEDVKPLPEEQAA